MNSEFPESVTPPAAPASEPDMTAADAPPADTAVAAAPAAGEPAPAVDVAAELKQLFPGLFVGRPKPVKLRIQSDIQERAPGKFSKAQLSAFLRRHTGGTGYLIALTQAKTRFDLDGNPAGEISAEHLAAAKEELARRRGVQQERQQQQEQERRNRGQLLWDFEHTKLTEANFCALKGVKPEELQGLLEIARKERAEAPPREERAPRHGRPEGRGEGRRDGPREGRRDGGRPGARAGGRGDGRPEGRGGRRPDAPRGPRPAAQAQAVEPVAPAVPSADDATPSE
ncbi:MAG: prop effector ProQ [Roseateles depolymerans]|uniref:Prop effector ProQ n=1 Tax=Roseateles depolymerans TaxID=76731 RepID=A0A2W5DP25_9BURK|nr:MAG: prop effector ProQ [Roseateles depolymerans]